MSILDKVPFVDNKTKEDFEEAEQVVLRLSSFNKKDIDEVYLRQIREGLKEEEYLDLENSKYYSLKLQGEEGQIAINAEIVYPEHGFVPTEDTEVHICDHHYFDASMEDFKIPSKREIIVNELPENEMDIEVADPWSMINRFDKYPDVDIFVVEDEKKYLCNGYYFQFKE